MCVLQISDWRLGCRYTAQSLNLTTEYWLLKQCSRYGHPAARPALAGDLPVLRDAGHSADLGSAAAAHPVRAGAGPVAPCAADVARAAALLDRGRPVHYLHDYADAADRPRRRG